MTNAGAFLALAALVMKGSAIIDLDFTTGNMTANDLGGAGMVFEWEEHGYALKITNTSEYQSGNIGRNGLTEGGYFASINVKAGSCVDLKVTVFNAHAKYENEWTDDTSYFFSVFDIDGKYETVQMNGFREYYMSNNSELALQEGKNGSILFYNAQEKGYLPDNPRNPRKLTDEQKKPCCHLSFRGLAGIPNAALLERNRRTRWSQFPLLGVFAAARRVYWQMPDDT